MWLDAHQRMDRSWRNRPGFCNSPEILIAPASPSTRPLAGKVTSLSLSRHGRRRQDQVTIFAFSMVRSSRPKVAGQKSQEAPRRAKPQNPRENRPFFELEGQNSALLLACYFVCSACRSPKGCSGLLLETSSACHQLNRVAVETSIRHDCGPRWSFFIIRASSATSIHRSLRRSGILTQIEDQTRRGAMCA
jgi:hypothetical protein